jgi:hypothetical protein
MLETQRGALSTQCDKSNCELDPDEMYERGESLSIPKL